jgi:putative chitinase
MRFLRIFQEQHKIPVTGIMGPITIRKIAEVLGITNKAHLAHFLGQVDHETGKFNNGRENLNYSVNGLLTTFGRHRISEVDARRFGRTSNQPANQQEIANRIYGQEWGRRNLGNTQPNDGWDFRGNGSLQLTGRANHQQFANSINDQSIMTNTDKIMNEYYFQSGKFFFDRNNLWRFCNEVNANSILTVSRAVNIGNPNSTGTPKGMQDRINQTNRYFQMLQNITL